MCANIIVVGTKANHNAMNSYVKSISKRTEGEEKDKVLPIGILGSAMATHGEDFEPDSEFGQCLIAMGRSNERIGRIQEGYISKATSSWLDSLERSVAQMKDYQVRFLEKCYAPCRTYCYRLPGRSWRVVAWLTTLLPQRWRKPDEKISGRKKNFDLKKQSMTRLRRMSFVE